MIQLALIIDKSQVFREFHRDRLLKEWEVEPLPIPVSDIYRVGGASLFGDTPSSSIEITTPDNMRQTMEGLETLHKQGVAEARFKGGVVLMCSLPRTSTKKLETLVTQMGGTVVHAKADVRKNGSPVESLLDQVNFNPTSRQFLVDYAGEDYARVIPIVNNMAVLSPEQQYRVGVDALSDRLPLPEGSVLPWVVEKPLMELNVEKTINYSRRVVSHSHPLVVVTILRNKFALSYRVAELLDLDPRISKQSLLEATAQNDNYPFKLACQTARKYGYKKLESCLNLLLDAEKNMKGYWPVDPSVSLEMALVGVISILRGEDINAFDPDPAWSHINFSNRRI